ncbi:DUF6233 domain-containing protein [Streptomyces ipomoeae]|uniref:DUF6233 domain-containing protein n=1 Tax=Streptomyces ipomoeae TaxID=103232 RepID=UPI0035A65632
MPRRVKAPPGGLHTVLEPEGPAAGDRSVAHRSASEPNVAPTGQRFADAAPALKRQTDQERGRRNRPPRPDWFIELGIGIGIPSTALRTSGCYAAGKRHRTVDGGEARHVLAAGLRACTRCRPDQHLDILDWSPMATPSPHRRERRRAGHRGPRGLCGPPPPPRGEAVRVAMELREGGQRRRQ